jgi:hypothetical protein
MLFLKRGFARLGSLLHMFLDHRKSQKISKNLKISQKTRKNKIKPNKLMQTYKNLGPSLRFLQQFQVKNCILQVFCALRFASVVVEFPFSQCVHMASSESSLVRAAKRSRTMSQGMGLNPMLMGLNPMLMSMFNQSMSPMLPPEEDDTEDHEMVQASAPAASSVATPKATPPAPTAAPGARGDEDYNEEFHNLSLDAPISRSITYLKQAPKTRLSEALEAVCPSLDATLTAQLSVPGMLAVLWTYTRILPTTKVSDLRSIAAILYIY